MEARINMSDISQKMCIDLVRKLIENNASATVHLRGKEKAGEDFVELLDVRDSNQVTALIPITFGSLKEIVVNPTGEPAGKTATKSSKAKQSRKTTNVNESKEEGKHDLFEYFKDDIEKIKQDIENPENYPSAFVKSVLGKSLGQKNFEKYVDMFTKLTQLKDDNPLRETKQIIEIIGKNDYNAFYVFIRTRYDKLNISTEKGFENTVMLYLSLYKN